MFKGKVNRIVNLKVYFAMQIFLFLNLNKNHKNQHQHFMNKKNKAEIKDKHTQEIKQEEENTLNL